MIIAAEISHTILAHLTSLAEVRQLLDDAGRAWRTRGDARFLLPALDGLLGALEDIQLHASTIPDARHRFILQLLGREAEDLLGTSLGRHKGTLASVGLWRDAAGVWQLDADAADRLESAMLAELCARFLEVHLDPFLDGWRTPARVQLMLVS